MTDTAENAVSAAVRAADADEPIALAALIRKRRDTAFEIGQMERATEAKRQELIHLDAVIRLFAPKIDPSATPARRHNPRRLSYFAHGEITRRCLYMLRDGATLCAADVAREAMADKQLNWETERALRVEFTRRITMQLNSMARNSQVAKIGSGRGVRWRLPMRESDLGIG